MESNDWLYAWARTHEIVREAIRPERGFAYVKPIPAEYQSRRVILLEGTRGWGPTSTCTMAIRAQGAGRFSI